MMPEFPSDAVTEMFPPPTEAVLKGWGPGSRRENWGAGPWEQEPDKVTWVDPETDLDCMIVRNHHGVLCGYVGVPRTHPWHGVAYNGCVNKHAPKTLAKRQAEAKETLEAAITTEDENHIKLAQMMVDSISNDGWMTTMDRWDCTDYSHEPRCDTPEGVINVHGGLTFSDKCHEGGRICHSPRPGRDPHVWWYGFDCGHCMDFSPGMEATTKELYTRIGVEPNPHSDPNATYDPETGVKVEHGQASVYRDMAYVKAEVESMAKQLHAVKEVRV